MKDITIFQGGPIINTENCAQERKIVFREPTTFHVGADGQIHFTETHERTKYKDFCVDLNPPVQYNDANTTMEDEGYIISERYGEEDYYYENNADYDITLRVRDHDEPISENDCFRNDPEEGGEIVAMFCAVGFLEVQKCCDINEDLNLRYLRLTHSYTFA